MRAWWDNPASVATLEGNRPLLLPGARAAALERLRGRIAGFTPEWRDLSDEDAGVALVRLFGLQLDPVLERVEKLPDKALRQFLSAAGIRLSSPRPAQTRVRFVPKEKNTLPVAVPEGFRLRSARSDGGAGVVTWETSGPLNVTNASLAEIIRHDGQLSEAVAEGDSFIPLANNAEAGAALYLGFAGQGDLSGVLSLGVSLAAELSAGTAIAGGAAAARPRPRLVWEYLGARGFAPLQVEGDDTVQLSQDGIVRLKLPGDWNAGRPDATGDGDPRYWLRLRLASGTVSGARPVAAIIPHVVAAKAQETHRGEYPLAEGAGVAKQARLAHAPVVSGSVVLEVDEGAAATDIFQLPSDTAGTGGNWRRWEEVDTLAGAAPNARVFTLDPLTGTLQFGDNREGAALPSGVRGLVVRAYATTLGGGGNVAPGAVDRMVTNLAGIDSVVSIDPGTGGADTEAVTAAEARGPGEIKARGRAVTRADIRLMAQEAEGADILRAFAVSGVDPTYPGAEIPGTVGVFVVARRHPSQAKDVPPRASSAALKAVAEHIATGVGPVGARVAVSNPDYQSVSVEATVVLASGADAEALASLLRSAIDDWLNPEVIDPVYGAISLGQRLRHADLNHLILGADPAVIAAPYLAFRVDGVLGAPCADAQLRAFSLPWPAPHRLQVEVTEAAS